LKIYTPKDFPLNFDTVVCIGSFDGIHKGHAVLFKETTSLAKKLNCVPVVVSFDPHPRLVLFPDKSFKLLTTLEEKVKLLKQQGMEHLVLLPFTPALAKVSPEVFVEEYLIDSLSVKGVVVGFNFRFGINRRGDVKYLEQLGKKYDFLVKSVDPVLIEGTVVSSTVIRQFLSIGDVEKANEFLGHPYLISGKVIKGAGRGRKLGFPTANLDVPEIKLIPAPGVYAVWVNLKGKRFKGALNIGTKPTFEEKELSIEVHLLNFKGELYEEFLELELVKRIRNELKFPSPEALKEQIKKDCFEIENFLEKAA